MSTSIHHGYRLGLTDLHSLQQFLSLARRVLGATAQELVATRLGEICCEIMDMATVGTVVERRTVADKYFIREGQNFSTPISLAKDWLRNRMQECERSMLRDIYNDLNCELSVFVADDGVVYALLHAERQQYHEALKSISGVSKYDYSSGEPPQGIPYEEWEARRVLWERLIPDGVASRSSLGCAKLVWPDCAVEPRKIVESAPSAEERARTIARQRIIGNLSEELMAAMKLNGDRRDHTQQMISAVCAAAERVSNGERDSEINREADHLTKLLKGVATTPNLSREFMLLPRPEMVVEPAPSAHVVRLMNNKREGHAGTMGKKK